MTQICQSSVQFQITFARYITISHYILCYGFLLIDSCQNSLKSNGNKNVVLREICDSYVLTFQNEYHKFHHPNYYNIHLLDWNDYSGQQCQFKIFFVQNQNYNRNRLPSLHSVPHPDIMPLDRSDTFGHQPRISDRQIVQCFDQSSRNIRPNKRLCYQTPQGIQIIEAFCSRMYESFQHH